jgi:hypothetical protein
MAMCTKVDDEEAPEKKTEVKKLITKKPEVPKSEKQVCKADEYDHNVCANKSTSPYESEEDVTGLEYDDGVLTSSFASLVKL